MSAVKLDHIKHMPHPYKAERYIYIALIYFTLQALICENAFYENYLYI